MKSLSSNKENSVSEETQKIFDQIEYEIQKSSKFIKLQNGDTKILRFNPDPAKIKLVDDNYKGKITKRVHYTVIDTQSPTEGERILAMSLTNARSINALLEKGMYVIEIKRVGSDQNTKYTFVPII